MTEFTSVADFTIKTHDTAPFIEQTLLDWEGNPVDIGGADVIFNLVTFGEVGTVVLSEIANNDQVSDGSDGTRGYVSYEWQDGDTATKGAYVAEWEVTFTDGEVQTFPSDQPHVRIWIEQDLGGAAS